MGDGTLRAIVRCAVHHFSLKFLVKERRHMMFASGRSALRLNTLNRILLVLCLRCMTTAAERRSIFA